MHWKEAMRTSKMFREFGKVVPIVLEDERSFNDQAMEEYILLKAEDSEGREFTESEKITRKKRQKELVDMAIKY